MARENEISSQNAMCLLILLITGSNFVFGLMPGHPNDQWLCILISFLFSIPFMLIYSRIVKLTGAKNIFETLETLFGKFLGKILCILVGVFSLHAAARYLAEFSETIGVSVLKNTPIMVITIMIMSVCIYLAKSSFSVIGKFSLVAFIIGYLINIVMFLISIPLMKFDNIMPVLAKGMNDIWFNSFNFSCLSGLEIVFSFAAIDHFAKNKNVKKIYLGSLLLAYLLIILVFLRTLFVLGPESFSIFYFPRYVALRLIKFGKFFERIENFSYYAFLVFGVVKIAIFLIVAARGLAKVFNIASYKTMITPVALFTISINSILANNIMEIFSFFPFYFFYSVPFQIIIPILMWIICEIKFKSKKNNINTNFALTEG